MTNGHFAKFIVVGIANTLIGLAIIYAAKALLRFDDLGANATGYGVGVLVSFVGNKRWTFGDAGAPGTAFARFLAVLAAAYVLNLCTVFGALELGIGDYVAQALGVFPYVVFSYLGCRYFVFRSRAPVQGAPRSDSTVPR